MSECPVQSQVAIIWIVFNDIINVYESMSTYSVIYMQINEYMAIIIIN